LTLSRAPSKVPLLVSIVVIVLLVVGFAYVYVTSSATVASQASSITALNSQVSTQAGSINALNSKVSSYQTEVSTLDANITHQISARNAIYAKLVMANATLASQSTSIVSLSSTVSSYSGQISNLNSEISTQQNSITAQQNSMAAQQNTIAAQQSTISLEVTQTIASGVALNMPFNSSTTVTSFTTNYAGYLEVSGTSNTDIAIGICYSATSASACDSSMNYWIIPFSTGGLTFEAPMEPGPVWINAYNYNAGTATITVALVT
jgi:cell division protein FtsL